MAGSFNCIQLLPLTLTPLTWCGMIVIDTITVRPLGDETNIVGG